MCQATDQIKDCLRSFGLNSFLPMQEEAILSIVEGNDTLTILPPGSGKSLIFQILALMRVPELTVVISPLIALMDDQVSKKSQLRAAQIHSGLSDCERKAIMEETEKGMVDILYISPEGLSAHAILSCIKGRKVGLMVIDEVHCVSLWGHNFRPSYLFISEIRRQLGNPQLALFTATAPPHVIEDVKRILGINEINVIMGESFRNNIEFEVINIESIEEKMAKLLSIISSVKKGAIIIYTATTGQAYAIYFALSENFKVSIYHGKMETEERRESFENFMSGETNIMVCTSAFGMGIDKSDIYTIIHYSIPGSLEAYVQESGRAGRDGEKSKAILFNSPNDYKTQHHFIMVGSPSFEKIRTVYEFIYKKNESISAYQCKPCSFAQLKLFLDRFMEEYSWEETMANAAVGILVDLGYIVREGENMIFPKGKDICIDEKILEERKIAKLKRFQMMLNYAQGEDHPEMIRTYFSTSVFNEIKINRKYTISGFEIILSFIKKYAVTTTKLLSVLTGDEKIGDKEKYGEYFGIYSEVWGGYIKYLLNDLAEKECLFIAEIVNSKIYFLSEIGEAYLFQKGFMSEEKSDKELTIHHFSFRNEIVNSIKAWQATRNLKDIELALFPKMHYENFLSSAFEIRGENVNGKELLLKYTLNQSYTVVAFKQFIFFFLRIREEKNAVSPKKNFRRGYKRFK